MLQKRNEPSNRRRNILDFQYQRPALHRHQFHIRNHNLRLLPYQTFCNVDGVKLEEDSAMRNWGTWGAGERL